MQDLRYIRTEKSIRDAFFKLLSQKNLSQITVTELSKEAFSEEALSICTTRIFMNCLVLLQRNISLISLKYIAMQCQPI